MQVLDDQQRPGGHGGRVSAERSVRHRSEQHPRVLMLRISQHFLGGAGLDDAA
jgi:hypothetical protein